MKEWQVAVITVLVVLIIVMGVVFVTIKAVDKEMEIQYAEGPRWMLITEACGDPIPVYRYRTYGGGLFSADNKLRVWTTDRKTVVIMGPWRLESTGRKR